MNIENLIRKKLRELHESHEGGHENYMFFGNLQQMHRQAEMLMNEDHDRIDEILKEHDWAQDHIAEAKSLLDQVFDFLMNETKNMSMDFKNETNLNESKLSFLQGKPISLIKTRHTVGKWNKENRQMDKIKTDEDFEGIIGQIGDYEGYYTPGFWVMNDNGKNKGFVLYDKKNDEFIEGDSTFYYTYKGKTEKDERLLNLFKINFIDTDKMYDNKLSESEHIDEGKNKPTNPKLWAQSLAWARARYKVCPSAYCNGAAAKRYKSKGGGWRKTKK